LRSEGASLSSQLQLWSNAMLGFIYSIAVIAAVSLTTLTVVAPTHAASDRVALVIGNGAYQAAVQLPNPANDAADIAETLHRIGFEVIEGRDLGKNAMENKIREFGRKLDKANLAIFFYAGHGLQVGGRNYLVPIDAKLERPGDLNFETIELSLVLAQMETEKRVNLVFLDACRDNPLTRSLARGPAARSIAIGQGLASVQSAIGTMISYSTQPDNVALDGDGRNSPFAGALLRHIATPGLEISSLMKRVRADVASMTRDKQVPWDHSSLTGDVILVPDGDSTAAVPVAPSALSPPAPAPSPPAATSRAPSVVVPAFTKNLLKEEPAIGKLPTGASVLVDDGTCPTGQIKQVIGGSIATGQPRLRSCVPRP
jgi:caspase domain-containing protein/uncharacterized protein DUF6719